MVVKIIAVLILSGLLFYAVVGAVFLHGTEPLKQSAEHCPRIVRYEDDTLACIIQINEEDDALTIIRGER